MTQVLRISLCLTVILGLMALGGCDGPKPKGPMPPRPESTAKDGAATRPARAPVSQGHRSPFTSRDANATGGKVGRYIDEVLSSPRTIGEKIGSVKPGMSIEQVTRILGEPHKAKRHPMGFLVLIYKGERQYHWIYFPEGMNISSHVTKIETQQDDDFFPSEDVEIVVTGGMTQFLSKREKPATLSFKGLSPKEHLDRVRKCAQQWKSDATLRGVFANRWQFYADRETSRLSTFEVTEWRFVFLAQGKLGTFVVTRDDAKLLSEENAPKQLGPDSLLGAGALEDWNVDIAAAIRIAAEAGGTVRDCCFLVVQSIDGGMVPVWTIPTAGAPVRINATSGQVLPLRDPTGSDDK